MVIIHFARKCSARRRSLQSAQQGEGTARQRGRVMDYSGEGGRKMQRWKVMEDGLRGRRGKLFSLGEGLIHGAVYCCWHYRPHRLP